MPERQDLDAVLVAGDVTIDWNLATLRGQHSSPAEATWWGDYSAQASWQYGGATLLANILRAVAAAHRETGQPGFEVRHVLLREEQDSRAGRFHHAYALLAQFDTGEPQPCTVWRVDRFLGFGPPEEAGMGLPGPRGEDRSDPQLSGARVALTVLADSDLGFRDSPEDWPETVTDVANSSWLLLKANHPVAQGPLWEHLHRKCGHRLIVLLRADSLRLAEVHISQELSWERTAQDLLWEVVHNPRINALSRCAYVVVSFDTAGALLLSRRSPERAADAGEDGASLDAVLFFDPELIEGGPHEAEIGMMIGYRSCLAAGMARQVLLDPTRPVLGAGIHAGLTAARLLFQRGYEEETNGAGTRLALPLASIAKALVSNKAEFAEVGVPDPTRFLRQGPPVAANSGKTPAEGALHHWTILDERYSQSLGRVARDVVLRGAEAALQGVPLGRFARLVTADRTEIESLRSISSLMAEYCERAPSRPLSIAVFGPPGAGKSFAVKQVAASVRPEGVRPLEFNLAQFVGQQTLYDAMHQVRDVGLSGQVPLVFWDEFDCSLGGETLGWLRHFLSPMQDGSFIQGQIIHPIGRAIFVFAGGMCQRMEDFNGWKDASAFKQAKGPDFVSRLKGYVNVLGPNPRTGGGVRSDPAHIIRRASALRSMLLRDAKHLFAEKEGDFVPNIDPGVLRAFLHTRDYHHGSRSMEAVIAMSLLYGKNRFERSCLPSASQLDLHVDGQEFLSLAQSVELEGELLERLAAENHAVYREGREREGWVRGPRNTAGKTSPLLVPYAELPEEFKESNRTSVRNIPNKLAAAGYVMVPARGSEGPFTLPDQDLEQLAHLEHDRWLADRLALGFTLGEPTSLDPKRSPHLVEWERLPDDVKQIDRELVRGIPSILARAGYTVVPLRTRPEKP